VGGVLTVVLVAETYAGTRLLSDSGKAGSLGSGLPGNSLAGWERRLVGCQLIVCGPAVPMAALTNRLAASPALLTSSATLTLSRKLKLENLRST